MTRIDSNARTIRQLLAGTKYQLDYYQREYSWQAKHITELLDDLSRIFLESYTEGDALTDVSNYNHYFLGSIIISYDGPQRYIVDGQQRLTTLTLLLISLYRLLEDGYLKNQVDQCIYSLAGGTEGFNLDVPEWHDLMEALYKDTPFDESDQSESIQNIVLCYRDVTDYFEIPDDAIPCFVYWLLENVYLVSIEAFDSRDAYTIFETVNDRGLSLTPTDMLRGYLLSNIDEADRRNRASENWRRQVQKLQSIDKEDSTDAIKAWLRSQHAKSIPDFDRIGSEFHRWVRDHEEGLGLLSSDGFTRFIERDFKFYSHWYYRLRSASKSLTPGLEYVYYNAQNNFTLQYPVLLAPLCIEDTEEEILNKIKITATYIDILIHRRLWNFLEIAQRSMADPMFWVMHAIRGMDISELRNTLYAWLENETLPFANNGLFHLHSGNRRKIFLILARMTDYVAVQSGESSRYLEYMRTGKNSYEIEHIWANHLEHHSNEFFHESEFEAYRNRIGGLLLLPKSVNASSGDDPYAKKRKVYAGQNLLARSLTEQAYRNNPGFIRFIRDSGLLFDQHPEFKKADLDARQSLYLRLAEQIWDPERLKQTEWVTGETHGHLSPPEDELENSLLFTEIMGGPSPVGALPAGAVRRQNYPLVVTMPDGKRICHSEAIDTLIEVIKVLGIEKVRTHGIMSHGIPLVAINNYDEKGQQPVGRYYIASNSSTDTKVEQIKAIARCLGVKLIPEQLNLIKNLSKT